MIRLYLYDKRTPMEIVEKRVYSARKMAYDLARRDAVPVLFVVLGRVWVSGRYQIRYRVVTTTPWGTYEAGSGRSRRGARGVMTTFINQRTLPR